MSRTFSESLTYIQLISLCPVTAMSLFANTVWSKNCYLLLIKSCYFKLAPENFGLSNIKQYWHRTFFLLKVSWTRSTEAVVQRCSVKKLFLKIQQNSQKNTSAFLTEIPTQAFSWEFFEFFKNTLFYRTRLVAASESRSTFWNFPAIGNVI